VGDGFAVSDRYGNVLRFGAGGRAAGGAERWIAAQLDSLQVRRSERRRASVEAPHLAAFREFYGALPDRRDVFYLFFSRHLLHWVAKAMRHVPAEVNLVLLGSDLPADERAWAAATGRPFHHVDLRIDDQIAWDFLFAVNRRPFGWLDSDCLVLDGGLFAEMSRLDGRSSMNCAWSWDSGFGFPLANTFFLFVDTDAIAEVRAAGLPASPYAHDFEWQNLQVPGRRCYARRPTAAQRARLLSVLPPGPGGRPATPYGMAYYDTMVTFQILARTCGRPVRQVRTLEGFGQLRGRPVQDESSDELVHIGGVSRADSLDEHSGYFHDRQVRLLYLIAESVILGSAPELPDYYRRRLDRVSAVLSAEGLDPAAARRILGEHLGGTRGLSPRAVAAVLDS
jgi:hypothetical protein